MILSALITILTALTPTIILLLRDFVESRQAQAKIDAPLRHQGEVDVEIASNKSALSIRISRLHEAIRQRRRRSERPDA